MEKITAAIKQAFAQINKNKAMSATSILAITSMMLIVGICFFITINVNLFTQSLKESYDIVEIFLEDEATPEQIEELQTKIEATENVEEVTYRTKEEAMEILKERWGENSYLLDSLGDNPLPNSILVTVTDIEEGKTLVEYCETLEGVEDINYYQETVEKMTQITDFLQIGSAVIMIFLVVISIIVVSNTIKLTVFNRAKEITIMQYIGATAWYIRGPFLAEGIILGAVSSITATLLTTFVYSQVFAIFGRDFLAVASISLIPTVYAMSNLACIFLAMGIGIGTWGSILSMRRFLGK